MSTRRTFLKQVALALMTAGDASGKKSNPTLTLLHSSESLSAWKPLADDQGTAAGRGGYEARFQQISRIRALGNPLLLLDSGNFISGSELADRFCGRVEMEVLHRMGYDAICLGERDADIGVEKLRLLLQQSRIPVISTNADDPAFRGLLQPFLVLQKGPFKIGLLALNRADGFLKVRGHPLTLANDRAKELSEKYNCDLVVCLSRLGQDERNGLNDFMLAAESEHIRVIAGASSGMQNPRPLIRYNRRNREVCVLGNPKSGTQMNQLDYKFSEAKTIFLSNAHTVVLGK